MSEKYWVFQNNQVVGPFGIDDLLVRPGFSGETLVCPEGRQGTDAGDWQRASLIAAISEAFLRPKSPSIPAPMIKPASNSEFAGDSLMVKELTLLGAVHEKIGALGQSAAQVQETLNEHGKELSAFRSGIEEKNRQFEELALRVKTFEGMDASLRALKEGLGKVGESESRQSALEEESRSQRRSIDELSQKIDLLSQGKESRAATDEKLAELSARLDALVAKIGESQTPTTSPNPSPSPEFYPAPPASQESSVSFPSPFALPDPISVGAQVAPNASPVFEPEVSSIPESNEENAFAPKIEPPTPVGSPPDFILPTEGFSGSESFSQQFAPDTSTHQSLPEEGVSGPTAPEFPEGFAGSKSTADRSSVLEPAKEHPPKNKKRAGLFILIVSGASLAALAYILGFIPGLAISKPESSASPHLSPPSSPSLPVPSRPGQSALGSLPQGQEETFRMSAIRLVQNWPVGETGKSISQLLGAPIISSGSLSPWMAEKIRNNLYQVNFYSVPAGTGAEKSYEFQADLTLQKVVGQNQAAVALLSGAPAVPVLKKPSKKIARPIRRAKRQPIKKRRVAKKTQSHKKDIARRVAMPKIPHSQPAAKQAVSGASLGPLPGLSNSGSQPASASSSASKPSTQPSEDQTLDQLLKP